VAALAALGGVGNLLGLSVGYNVTFIFGSIFPIIAIAVFGTGWGVVAAALAASTTWLSWNHPWAVVIFTCEALWLGLAHRRGHRSLLLADTVFWALGGAPLVALFYHGVMHVDWQATGTILLKLSLNGVFDTLVASVLIEHLPLVRRRLHGDTPHGTPMRHVFFQLTALLVMVPTLFVIVVDNRREAIERQAELVTAMTAEQRGVQQQVSAWLEQHVAAARALSAAGARAAFRPASSLQDETARLRQLFPDFHNVYVADATARTIAFDPPINERGESTIGLDFSDRPYFADLTRTHAPVVSEIFLGRGGIFVPIFSISVPVVEGGTLRGFGLGAVNVERLGARLGVRGGDGNFTATLVDRDGRVVASSSVERKPFDRLPSALGTATDVGGGVTLYMPGATKHLTAMGVWKEAFYESQTPIAGTPWTLRLEAPVAPLQAALYAATSRSLVLVAALYAAALLLATVVSRALSAAPGALARLSRDLPARLEGDEEIVWPASRVEETRLLIENFRHTAEALRERMRTIKHANARLGEHVAERTRELEDKTRQLEAFTSGLEQRIAEEIALRQRNEQMLFQQSKLASMGEMIGAIAHQWRQPLNVLGLIVQNFRDDVAEVEASPAVREGVDRMVGRSMTQIRQMSKTIEDFRGFFVPDREETDFDAMVAAGEVVSLVSAQLASSRVTVQLVCHAHGRVASSAADVVPCAENTIRTRRNEFEHVVLNLVNNAREAILERRHRDGGGGAITIEFRGAADPLTIEIRDDGGGVDPALLDRIFEPYFTTKLRSGTGLGLYLSKLILEEHCHGRLSARNEDDGAVFHIELPRAPAAAAAAPSAPS
jgi:signal transduction histidine kinase